MITKRKAEAGTILARRMMPDSDLWLPNLLYLEYHNVASPGDVVSPPAFAYTDTVSYYAGLSGVASRDYIRVPFSYLTPETTNITIYPLGNIMSAIGNPQNTGLTTGVHGKPFASASNSKIIGGAIVAHPVPGDHSKDLQFIRFYLQGTEQFLYLESGQNLIPIRFPFTIPAS